MEDIGIEDLVNWYLSSESVTNPVPTVQYPMSASDGLDFGILPTNITTGYDDQPHVRSGMSGEVPQVPHNPGPKLEKLKTIPYSRGNMSVRRQDESFPTCDYDQGFSMGMAYQRTFTDMHDHDKLAFPGIKLTQKPTIRIHVEEFDFDFHHQFNVLTDNGKRQPSRAYMAHVCAKATKRYIDELAVRGKAFPYKLQDIYLIEVKRMSQGCLQMTIAVAQRQ